MEECEAATLLKRHKLKITHQRLLVLDEMIRSHSFFSANSLYKKLREEIDLATIYRMLLTFQKKTIVREVAVKDSVRFYELICVHQSAHPHFLCKECNTMFCLEITPTKLAELKKYAPKFLVEEISLLLTGTCENCEEQKKLTKRNS